MQNAQYKQAQVLGNAQNSMSMLSQQVLNIVSNRKKIILVIMFPNNRKISTIIEKYERLLFQILIKQYVIRINLQFYECSSFTPSF